MLGSQITTANEFVPRGIQPVNDMQLLPFKLPSTQDKPASTVNINVKVDPTTSIAQVGQKLATTIQKYTAIGGGAGGSAMPWQVL
jgi:hypothetical protein